MAHSKEMLTIEISSDADKESLCAPCKAEGEHRQATKYCIDCGQLVCKNCVDSHRRFKELKGHKLVDSSNEDDLKLSQMLSSCLICPNHPDKTIELVCKNHDVLCCLTCATVSHRGCREVVEVGSQAADVKQESVTDLKNHLVAAKSHMEEIVKKHKQSNIALTSSTDVLLPKQLQDLILRVNQILTALEKSILSESQTKKKLHMAKHDAEITKWNKNINSISEAYTLLNSVQQNGSEAHVYVVVNKIQKLLADIDVNISNQGNQFLDESFVFKECPSLQQVSNCKSPRSLVELSVTKKVIPLPQYKYTSSKQSSAKKQYRRYNPYSVEDKHEVTQRIHNPYSDEESYTEEKSYYPYSDENYSNEDACEVTHIYEPYE